MRKPMLTGTALVASALAAAPALATTFTYTGADQTFVVPSTGLYDIVAYGAQRGSRSDVAFCGGPRR